MKLPKPSRPVRIHVPVEMRHDVGLGDAVKRLTSSVGIQPCGPCQQHAAAMNHYLTFTGRKSSTL